MTTEYKTVTVSRVMSDYVFFEEIGDFVSIQESLKGVQVGDKVRLGIDRSNVQPRPQHVKHETFKGC